MLPNMNLHPHYQQQRHPATFPSAPQGSAPTTDTAWPGDEMLHIYLCDYLRKRGYTQAANLLHHEADLDPSRPIPIDAPQSLLFEWWVVFWDLFASRTSPTALTSTTQPAATAADGVTRRKSLATPAGALPQLDLEASQKLGLTRPASRIVIQQCMGMMSLGGKNIDALTEAERSEVGKRVSRLQTAQGDAQMRLAQLHGLQPPKALLNTNGIQAQQMAGSKRKENPNGDAGRVAPQQQLGSVPLVRRLSQPVQSTAPNAPSPLGNMAFAQPSPHSTMQNQSPASTAPNFGLGGYTMNPPAPRPSVLAPDPNLQIRSPHQGLAVHPSGLPTAPPSSLSPATEWPAAGQQLAPPLLRQSPRASHSNGANSSQAIPLQQRFQISLPPTKPSVFAPVGFADGNYGSGNGGFSAEVEQGGGGGTGERVLTPFAD